MSYQRPQKPTVRLFHLILPPERALLRTYPPNRRLILTYLIPCRLVTSHTLPSRQLLQLFPRLEALFLPLCHRIKHGDLSGFDAAMAAGEHEFVKKRIYLPLESGRDIAMRNLFRKVFIAGGYDPAVDGQPAIRRTRVPVVEFAAAMRIGRDWTSPREADAGFDMDEVECYLANMIYQVCFLYPVL